MNQTSRKPRGKQIFIKIARERTKITSAELWQSNELIFASLEMEKEFIDLALAYWLGQDIRMCKEFIVFAA